MCAAAWMVAQSIYVYVLAVHVPTHHQPTRQRVHVAAMADRLGVTVVDLRNGVALGRLPPFFIMVPPTLPRHHRRTVVCMCNKHDVRRARRHQSEH